MARHPMDSTRDRMTGARLVKFLQVLRQGRRHDQTETLLRRTRSRNPHSGRVAGMLKPQRGS